MGIDAELFVRIKDPTKHLASADELKAAYDLSSTIGHEHFFITEGQHALSIVEPLSNADDCLSRLVGKIVHFQDGPPIVAEPNEQFITVQLWSRYYGPGYERGDWMVLRTTIEWLRRRFPSGEIWYGGDSSGVCAEHMTSEKLAAFDELFFKSGRHGYTHVALSRSSHAVVCQTCRQPTAHSGGGGGDTYHWCAGCGTSFVCTASGAVYVGERNQDLFKLHYQINAGLCTPAFNIKEPG